MLSLQRPTNEFSIAVLFPVWYKVLVCIMYIQFSLQSVKSEVKSMNILKIWQKEGALNGVRVEDVERSQVL